MKVWEFMEMIHSRSYTYIIKNVYANPSDVFDTIVKEPRILERAASVTESYDDFISSAATYASGNEWQHVLDGVPAVPQTHSMNSKENFTEQSLTSTSWKELDSMSPSHVRSHLVNLNSWRDRSKIISLIARDENQHLVITQNILNKW